MRKFSSCASFLLFRIFLKERTGVSTQLTKERAANHKNLTVWLDIARFP